MAAAVRTAALWIVRHNYADFGPTMAAEKLAGLHGFAFSVLQRDVAEVDDRRWAVG
jgi:hypothetical protein